MSNPEIDSLKMALASQNLAVVRYILDLTYWSVADSQSLNREEYLEGLSKCNGIFKTISEKMFDELYAGSVKLPKSRKTKRKG